MENQGLLLDAELPHSSWCHPQPQTVSALVQGGVGGTAGMAGSIYTPWSTLCSSQSSNVGKHHAKSSPEDRNRNSFALLIT